ncbi:MAG: hypothetical protein P8X64_10960 [Anaerolineales bacterium]|jgi:hypothetical protein
MEGRREQVRRLLKTFGIQADEALITHMARLPGDKALRIRLVLEDHTDYGDSPPETPLHLEIEGMIEP